MRRFVIAAFVTVLLAAAGCSSSGTPAASSTGSAPSPPPASPAGPPADGGAYLNTTALLDALRTGGAPCLDPQPVANPTAKGALSMTDCGSSAGQSDVVVVVFDTHDDTQNFAEGMTAPGPLAAEAVVYGQNWAINTTGGYAAQVQRILGGGELTGPSPSAS